MSMRPYIHLKQQIEEINALLSTLEGSPSAAVLEKSQSANIAVSLYLDIMNQRNNHHSQSGQGDFGASQTGCAMADRKKFDRQLFDAMSVAMKLLELGSNLPSEENQLIKDMATFLRKWPIYAFEKVSDFTKAWDYKVYLLTDNKNTTFSIKPVVPQAAQEEAPSCRL